MGATYFMIHPAHFRPVPPSKAEVGNNYVTDTTWNNALAIKAVDQWLDVAEALLRTDANVIILPAAPGLPDQVFAADGLLAIGDTWVVSNYAHPERVGEREHYLKHLHALNGRFGFNHNIYELPPHLEFEGSGNTAFDTQRGWLFVGHGQRSSAGVIPHLRQAFPRNIVRKIIGMNLTRPEAYHVDTGMVTLPYGELVWLPAAFDKATRTFLQRNYPERIEVTREEARNMACNIEAVDHNQLVMPAGVPRLKALLGRRYHVQAPDVTMFQRAGGSVHCVRNRASGLNLLAARNPPKQPPALPFARHAAGQLRPALREQLRTNPPAPVHLAPAQALHH